MEPSPLLLRPLMGLVYQSQITDDDDDECGATGEMNEWQGKPKYSEKAYPSVPLSTINPTWRPRLESGPPRWEAGDEPRQSWHSRVLNLIIHVQAANYPY
jgi:hypothetical protein